MITDVAAEGIVLSPSGSSDRSSPPVGLVRGFPFGIELSKPDFKTLILLVENVKPRPVPGYGI